MDAPKARKIPSSTDASRLYECKYCLQKFYPLLAHDLHVMARHGTEWASAPFFTDSGAFSLATNDLLKIAQREFGSLRSVSIDDVRRSTSTSVFRWTPTQEKMTETRKRRMESEDSGRESLEDQSKKSRSSSSPIDRSGSQSIKMEDAKSGSSASDRPKNTTTFVARSISVSRRNRLAIAGKPYYLQRASDRHRLGNDHAKTDMEIHAFRCYPKTSDKENKEKSGVLYVFQPSDPADLLRNLTWKMTKALRQGRDDAVIRGCAYQGSDAPRFSKGGHSWRGKKRSYQDRYDDRQYWDQIQNNNNPIYSQRVRSGYMYDARLDKVQANSDVVCELKNSLHLYLYQSPAGDRPSSETPFGRTDNRGKETLFGKYKESRL